MPDSKRKRSDASILKSKKCDKIVKNGPHPNTTKKTVNRCISGVEKVIVVPHTHWDREWYSPFQVYRMKLVKLMGKLLETLDNDETFTAFTLDGQAITLEDHLEIVPLDRERIERHVKSGRLAIGPWYVLPDEFLVSGEAIIRNLQEGHRVCSQFGRVSRVGYEPDAFGHISQMPQILNGFGIDNFIFTRGLGPEGEKLGEDFFWLGPDGKSRVLATHQFNGYCNGYRLGWPGWPWEIHPPEAFDPAIAERKIRELASAARVYARTPLLLVNNGCDHLEPQPELPALLAHLQGLTGTKFLQDTYEGWFRELQQYTDRFDSYVGELRSPNYHFLLPGVASTRIYLKHRNFIVQRLLEKWAEPFSSFAILEGAVPSGHSPLLHHAWKMLLKNHPHDSICGCSIDQVHNEMMPRFDQAEQLANEVIDESLKGISRLVDTKSTVSLTSNNRWADTCKTAIVVYNPLPYQRDDCCRLKVSVRSHKNSTLMEGLKILDHFGFSLPVQVLSANRQRVADYRPPDEKFFADTYDIILSARLNPLGYTSFALLPCLKADMAVGFKGNKEAKNPSVNDIKAGPMRCTTSCLDVRFNKDGTFDVKNISTGVTYPKQNGIEDRADAGDEYNYSPVEQENGLLHQKGSAKISLISPGPVAALYRIDVDMTIPESLDQSRKKRSGKTVRNKMTFEIIIPSNSQRIEIKADWENLACDHRLRALFPAPIHTDRSCLLSHFDVVERYNVPPPLPAPKPGANPKEQPRPEGPSQGWISISDGKIGMTVVGRGLPEVEGMPLGIGKKNDTAIALTLLRSVGWLSRGDLSTRPRYAGPFLETPEAQCIGKRTAEYSVIYHKGDWEKSTAYGTADEYLNPQICRTASLHSGRLKKSHSFLSIDNPAIRLSAICLPEGYDALKPKSIIVRIWNISSKPQSGLLKFAWKVSSARCVDLLGCDLKQRFNGSGYNSVKIVKSSGIELSLRQREIATFEITFSG